VGKIFFSLVPLLTLRARPDPHTPRVRPPFGVLFISSLTPPAGWQTAYEPRCNEGQEGYCSAGNFPILEGKGGCMPSYAYFEELTTAVLMDADEVKGFLKQKSPEEVQELVERMHERIVETFTKLLEVEVEKGGSCTCSVRIIEMDL